MRQFIPSSTTLNKNTCIRDSNGKHWNITIASLGKKLCFEAGWEEFCKAHSLEFGDFLLFGYNAFDSSFTVQIFGRNGCKKEFPGPSEIIEIESDNEEEKIRLKSKIGILIQKALVSSRTSMCSSFFFFVFYYFY